MSGHSKWSTIKRQKGTNDAARGQLFTKLGAKITIAVREGGNADPNDNVKLRLAIEKARNANMPKSNIDRAISRAISKDTGNQLESIVYEGFGPDGVAILVEAITDNRQRTSSLIKNVFANSGGVFATQGSVKHNFDYVGEIIVAKKSTFDDFLQIALETTILDVIETPDDFIVYTLAGKLHDTKVFLESHESNIVSSELIFHPIVTAILIDENKQHSLIKLLESLESLEDVHKVYTNAI